MVVGGGGLEGMGAGGGSMLCCSLPPEEYSQEVSIGGLITSLSASQSA